MGEADGRRASVPIPAFQGDAEASVEKKLLFFFEGAQFFGELRAVKQKNGVSDTASFAFGMIGRVGLECGFTQKFHFLCSDGRVLVEQRSK